MTNTHIHVPERPFWDRDIYGSAMHNGVPVFSKIGRGPRGYKGDKGDKGDTGAAGEDGFSPWTEFLYPGDTDYPLDPGDTGYGHPVIVVHDRDGDHYYPLDPKPDPSQMSGDDIARLALKLWNNNWFCTPYWENYCGTLDEAPLSGTGDYSNWSKFDASKLNLLYRSNGNHAVPTPAADLYETAGGEYAPKAAVENFVSGWDWMDARFSRNGLEYAFVNRHSAPNTPAFFLQTETVTVGSNQETHIFVYLYPKIASGHKLEECLLSLKWVPRYSYVDDHSNNS